MGYGGVAIALLLDSTVFTSYALGVVVVLVIAAIVGVVTGFYTAR